MATQEFELERGAFDVKFEVLLGRALSSDQVVQRGRTRPVLFHLELRDKDSGVTVKVGSQADLNLDADEETVESQIIAQRDALIEQAKKQVVPLRATQEDERQAEERIERILAAPQAQ